MADAYFTTRDGIWFQPTAYTRGPWDADSCHAGPPTALMVRAVESLGLAQRLVRITVEFYRPIPMAGFRVQAAVRRPGRSVAYSRAELFDDRHLYARLSGLHIREAEVGPVPSPELPAPDFSVSVPGPFPIRETAHGLVGFTASVECRYDPSTPDGAGGPTTVWVRTLVPILPDEEPSPFQRICPLADSGNGISFNAPVSRFSFINPDLTVFCHRPPTGDWFGSRSVSHWHGDGIGVADAELFDVDGPIGRATQSLILSAVEQ
ncbi:MAG: hypothetical protein KatS3mg011_0055 [Acidimicrobiia bacterium]|nr:MAG: hypothetical protein KatS3mg011_0055 [Acidimicrobiia bacterium]